MRWRIRSQLLLPLLLLLLGVAGVTVWTALASARLTRRQIEDRMRIYIDMIRGTLRELKTAGRLRDVDPTVACFSVVGMILWLPRWYRQGGRLSQEQVANEIMKLAVNGVVQRRSVARLRVHRTNGASRKARVR